MLLVLRTSRPAYGLVQATLIRASLDGPGSTIGAGSGPTVLAAVAACLRAVPRSGADTGGEAGPLPLALPPPEEVALLAAHGPVLIAGGAGVWIQILRA